MDLNFEISCEGKLGIIRGKNWPGLPCKGAYSQVFVCMSCIKEGAIKYYLDYQPKKLILRFPAGELLKELLEGKIDFCSYASYYRVQ